MDEDDRDDLLRILMEREPIFHRREFGTDRPALEAMTDEEFFEIGASGRIYSRAFVISNVLKRYAEPEPHDWPCRDAGLVVLADDLYLVTYLLKEPTRFTRRTTIWRWEDEDWKIVFHQGTPIEER